jgi:hypothetical protein
LRPTLNLEDQVSLFMSPNDRVAVISPGTGFLFHRPLQLAGLRWRYSNPPPYGDYYIIIDYNFRSYQFFSFHVEDFCDVETMKLYLEATSEN